MCEVIRFRYPYLGIYVNSFGVDAGGKTLLIDSGLASGRAMLAPYANRNTALLATHGHWDHTGSHRFLQSRGAALYAHAGDEAYLAQPDWQWQIQFQQFAGDFALPPARRATYLAETGEPVRPDVYLRGGETLQIGSCPVTVLATPGHSAGSVCFLLPDDGILFTGDTLMGDGFFSGLPQCADPAAYRRSMETLAGLAVKTVYCDHNDPLPGDRLAAKAEAGAACMARIGRRVEAFVNRFHGAPGALLSEAVQDVCQAENRAAGSGACITVLAHLKNYPDHPAVAACLQTHTPL